MPAGRASNPLRETRDSMIRTVRRLCLAMLLALPVTSPAGSNLDGGVYPAPRCGARPRPPERPQKFRTERELERYNQAVEQFNTGMDAFVGCVQSYVDDASADIALIRRHIDEAVRAANE